MYELVMRLVETGYTTFDEAYDLMPYELNALVKGRQAVEQRSVDRDRLFFGSIISTYINAHRAKNQRAIRWDEVFKVERPITPEEEEQDIEAALDRIERAMFG